MSFLLKSWNLRRVVACRIAMLVAIGLVCANCESVLESQNNSQSINLPLEEVSFQESPGELDRMGTAIATAGSIKAVGIPGLNRVLISERDGDGTYAQTQTLSLPTGLNGIQGNFGNALAFSASGDLLVVGTMKEDYGGNPPVENFTGRVLLYERVGDNYQLRNTLVPSTGHKTFGRFGQSLAIVANQAIVVSEEGQRQVHVYEYNSVTNAFPSSSSFVVNQVSCGMTPNLSWITSFGTAVAASLISGKLRIAVGAQDAHLYAGTFKIAPNETTPDIHGNTAGKTGTVVLIEKNGDEYTMIDYLIPELQHPKTKNMGYSIVMKGRRLVTGAIFTEINIPMSLDNVQSGTALVWELDDNDKYTKLATVDGFIEGLPNNTVPNAHFGYAVDLCGPDNRYIVVGRPGGRGTNQGRVFLYRINGPNDIELEQHFVGSAGNGAPGTNDLNDQFGYAVNCNDFGDFFVGAPFGDNPNQPALYDGSKAYWFQ